MFPVIVLRLVPWSWRHAKLECRACRSPLAALPLAQRSRALPLSSGGVEVGPLAPGEVKQKHRSVAAPISDHRAISAALALTRPCGSLLDQPAAEACIYKSASASPCSALAMALPSILSVIPSRRWGDIQRVISATGFRNSCARPGYHFRARRVFDR